jgi:hypothetical protein
LIVNLAGHEGGKVVSKKETATTNAEKTALVVDEVNKVQKILHMSRYLLNRVLTFNAVATLLVFLTQCASPIQQPSAESSYAPAPATTRAKMAERPGLGTGLGDELQDRSEKTSFYAKAHGAPDGVASFHYNDEEGAKLMAEQQGRVSKRSGSFELVPHRLRASLVSGWRGSGPAYSHFEAGGKVFVIGRPGQTYAIRLENMGKENIMVVVSVDGLDVLSGKPASIKAPGHVIAPGKSALIEGMRSDSKLRAFEFSKVSQSQAAKAYGEAGARNVGVIGVALFEEDASARKRALLSEGAVRDGAQAFSSSY